MQLLSTIFYPTVHFYIKTLVNVTIIIIAFKLFVRTINSLSIKFYQDAKNNSNALTWIG